MNIENNSQVLDHELTVHLPLCNIYCPGYQVIKVISKKKISFGLQTYIYLYKIGSGIMV